MRVEKGGNNEDSSCTQRVEGKEKVGQPRGREG